jgi:Ca2+-binding EF-hand superfamily protein
MNIKRLALLTVAATTLATAAYAQGGPGGFLKKADLNSDGAIDQTEFQSSRDKWFGEIDTNKDGFLAADEVKVFSDKMHAEWTKKHGDQASNDQKPKHGNFGERIMKRVDTDQDGKVSKAEFDAAGAKLFARLDDNSDGKVAGDEMPMRHWAKFGGKMFDRMDGDQDGKVTKTEFEAAGQKMFQRMDKNGDGIIEKSEMQPPHGDTPPATETPTP